MRIISAQDPPHFPAPFSINDQGWLQAPAQGLKGQAQKVSVTQHQGLGAGLPWLGSTAIFWKIVLGFLNKYHLSCLYPPPPTHT